MKHAFLNLAVVFCWGVTLCNCNITCHLGVYESGVPPSDITKIVNKHNYYRNLISNGQVPGQPRGINLKPMRWDARLAQLAQNIADTCLFQYVPVFDGRWDWVGQNLALFSSSAYQPGAKWDNALQLWFNGHEYYHYPDTATQQTGAYTQIVWGDTVAVGCGYTFFPTTNSQMKFKKLYICNYGPGGNAAGVPPYKTQPPIIG